MYGNSLHVWYLKLFVSAAAWDAHIPCGSAVCFSEFQMLRIQLPATVTGRAADGGSRPWVLATHMGDQDGESWLVAST